MKLVILLGNISVGKMTVGQALMEITDLRLFHNHMTIEPVIEIFGYYHPEVIGKLRNIIFDEFAKSENEGMIFTYVCDFSQPDDWQNVQRISDVFKAQGAEIYYVELLASKEVRIQRNSTENRLKHKASKRDLEVSHMRLLDTDEKYRCESYEGEIQEENYYRIENGDLTPKEVAVMIKERFKL